MSAVLRTFVLLIPVLLSLAGCSEDPVNTARIGFVACMAGKECDLGHSGRDGALIAIEEINSAGGAVAADGSKYQLELLTTDISGSREETELKLLKAINSKVDVLIGPMLSQKATELVPLANRYQIPMISPTVSTHLLAEMDDYFYRVYPTCMVTAPALASHAVLKDNVRSFSIIFDPRNKSFSTTWIKHFTESVESLGGRVGFVYSIDEFGSKEQLVDNILKNGTSGILCILNSVDTAMIAQRLKLNNSTVKLFGTEWSTTDSLKELAGQAIDGATFVASFDTDGQQENYLEFVQIYRRRFGHEPYFSSAFGYETIQVLKAAISRVSDLQDINQSLKSIGHLEGLQGELFMDQYGDIKRDVFIGSFVNGKFKVVEKIKAESIESQQNDN